MSTQKLKSVFFENHVKQLQEEAKAMIKFVQEGEVLTYEQDSRLDRIYAILDAVFARKNAYEEMMRNDMKIIRNFDALGIDYTIEAPSSEEVEAVG